MTNIMTGRLECPDGSILAYRRLIPKKNHNQEKNPAKEPLRPGVVFLGGYMSDMMGSKASYLEGFCEEHNLAYVRFDYFAHGSSPGEMQESTIGRWKENSICVLDNLTEGPQVLVGSSMGGWLMFLVTLLRQDRIKGLIGIAPATDFVDHLLDLTEEHEEQLEKFGLCYIKHKQSGYSFPLPKKFVDDAREHRVFPEAFYEIKNPKSKKSVANTNIIGSKKLKHIPIDCPVRILHGMKDDEVPWQHSIKLVESLKNDAQLILIKDGNHRLSRPEDLQLLSNVLTNLI